MSNSPNVTDESFRRQTKRSFSKCAECRRDHKRCMPAERQWNKQVKEKCQRCKKKGHPCGPNIRLLSRQQQEESDIPARTNTDASHIHNARQIADLQYGVDAVFSSATSSTINSAISTPNSSFRPMSILSSSLAPLGGSLTMQRQISRLESDTDSGYEEPLSLIQEARKSLSVVGTYQELHHVLQERIKAVVVANTRIGPLDSFNDMENALSAFESAVKQEAYSRMQHALAIARQPDFSTSEKELLLSRLHSLLHRFLQTLTKTVTHEWNDEIVLVDDLRNLQASVVKELSSLHESQGDLSEASHLRRSCFAAIVSTVVEDAVEVHHANEAETQVFRDASTRMWKTLKSLKYVPAKYRRLVFSPVHNYSSEIEDVGKFPPSHLALLEGKVLSGEVHKQASSGTLTADLIGRTALHVAVETGNVEVTKMLLRKSPNLATSAERDICSLTPLAIAAYQADLPTFKVLVEFGADTEVRDIVCRNLLAIACRAGSKSIVEYLLSKQISSIDRRGMCSPLHEALSGGHEEIAWLLLGHGDNLQQWRTSASAMAFDQGFSDLGHKLVKLEGRKQGANFQWISTLDSPMFETWLDSNDAKGFSNSSNWSLLLRDCSKFADEAEENSSSCSSHLSEWATDLGAARTNILYDQAVALGWTPHCDEFSSSKGKWDDGDLDVCRWRGKFTTEATDMSTLTTYSTCSLDETSPESDGNILEMVDRPSGVCFGG